MTMRTSESYQTQLRAGNGLIRFSAAVLFISSLVKFLHPAKAVAYMNFLGYANEKLFLIAAIELLTAFLFVRRSTRPAGLLLVSAYFGGAIAAHLAYHPLTGSTPIILFDANHPYIGSVPPILILSCAWAGAWLRHPELFGRIARQQRDAESRSMRAA
jgi:hypothetical protein